MRDKGFGHLKTMLFTIKTSQHVGLNSPFCELTCEQVTFCPTNVTCQALGKIILVFTYGSGCAARGAQYICCGALKPHAFSSCKLGPPTTWCHFYLVDLGWVHGECCRNMVCKLPCFLTETFKILQQVWPIPEWGQVCLEETCCWWRISLRWLLMLKFLP